MALLNRGKGGRLYLGESGKATLDAPFTEHNAPLVAADVEDRAAVQRAILSAVWEIGGIRRFVVSGVPPAVLAMAGGLPCNVREQEAPLIDLEAIRRTHGGDWLRTLSANTRYQIRRSARHYTERGPLRLERAASPAQALAWFDAMAALHGESWRRRGQPGAFADAFALRFHRDLVLRAQARGQLDLLRLTAGEMPIAYLYNFRLGGRVYAYQSGLDLVTAGPHGKPGLTCHAMAVEQALAAGDTSYDFLAGAARYKLSLANDSQLLLWAETVQRWSLPGLMAQAQHGVRRRLVPA